MSSQANSSSASRARAKADAQAEVASGSSSSAAAAGATPSTSASASWWGRVRQWCKRQVQDKIQRTRNLTLLRNVGLFGLAVYFVRHNEQYVCPPPTENLTRLMEEQQRQMRTLQEQHLASIPR